jgi:hypothetical protein
MSPRTACLAIALLALPICISAARAEDSVSLMAPKEARFGWSFGNGAEFPGATGELTVDADVQRDGRDSLKLVGDFTKGGAYVAAGRRFKETDIRELSFWVRNPDGDRITLLINDAGGQTHKFVLKTERGPDWQRLVLPLEQFFARRGQADAVTNVARYESWGGAKDQSWHGPATALHITLDRPREADGKVRRFWFQDVAVLPRTGPVAGVVRLDEVVEGEHDWQFTRHEEFPGAKGTLTLVQDDSAPGKSYLKLAGDFTGGGAAVAALKSLKSLEVKDVTEIRLQVKSDNATAVGVQLVDASGQTHQRKGIAIKADGKWHDLTIKPKEIAGGEHWGGANDAKWHGPATLLSLALAGNADPAGKQPVVLLADIRAEVVVPVFVQPPAFTVGFEGIEKLPGGWTAVGDVAVDAKTAFKGAGSLVLARTLEAIEKPCSAVSPSFKVAPGQWLVRLACKSDLKSSDDSYNGVVTLECLDDAGKVIEGFPVAELFGQRDWQEVSKRIEVPKGVASARFRIQLNKSHGRFWVDELSAAYIGPAARKDDRISRVLFSTAQLGNLLFPDDPRRVTVTVEAIKPLRDDQRVLTYEVRDYWGAEQTRPATIALPRPEKKGNRYVYEAGIDLGGEPLETGRYYELHASLPREGGEPFRNYTSFAILPPAVTKRFKPEEVPFTSRAWDNRNAEYIRLSDRLGIRVCGIWGGWSSKPYAAEAPGLDLCKELGMGWLTGTPIHTIEQGKEDYDEKALRQGVRNLIEKYGKARPMIIDLGNEPHGKGEVVRANVEAYRVVYEEIKKVDPNIVVVATAVEPNEEYFKAGYGKWCDVYDFHIYESAEDVRRTVDEYRALMKKYGQEKPLWSTELGLNSQGETRHGVAVELTKKFTTFFAAGGVNVSWFGLLYPDPEGKLQGTSGDSHNVFDCRYNRYCPRLDAIAYYNAVNAIAVKKFFEEKTYPGGVHAFLFRDADRGCLQVLWKDRGRQDVSVPLAGVREVEVIRVDGSRRALQAAGTGVTLTVGEDPLLLQYTGEAGLAPALDEPVAALVSPPSSAPRAKAATLTVSLADGKGDDVELIAPPFWAVKKTVAGGDKPTVSFTLTPPESTAVRELDITIALRGAKEKRRGELYFRGPVTP